MSLETVEQAVVSMISPTERTAALSGVADSVLRALAYSDLFDYPLNLSELARYQIGTHYTVQQIKEALANDLQLSQLITASDGGFYCLRGREQNFDTRRAREAASQQVWRRARFHSALLSRLPFVRMIAVTGALAVNNIAARPDIDLLVVTKQGRVWIARRLIVMLVRMGRIMRDDICPNYIISECTLDLDQQDLFTAHELAQMVPLWGATIYTQMLEQNRWALEYLPSAFESSSVSVPNGKPGPFRKVVEWALNLRVFDGWERAELARLRKKLRPLVGQAAEVVCSPTQCKGHTGLHRQWVTTRYEERLRDLNLS